VDDTRVSPEALLAAVDAVVAAATAGPSPEAPYRRLAAALDRLTGAILLAERPFDEATYPEPPAWDYETERGLVARRFPLLGHYNAVAALTTEVGTTTLVVGDAVDDLADILGDLRKVVWRARHTSLADAVWHLQASFVQHWGTHARALQQVLHAVLLGD
jgi:hypothetical protein